MNFWYDSFNPDPNSPAGQKARGLQIRFWEADWAESREEEKEIYFKYYAQWCAKYQIGFNLFEPWVKQLHA